MEASELRQRAVECRKAAVVFDELADAFATMQAHVGEMKVETRKARKVTRRKTRRARKTTRRARKIITLNKNYSRKTGAVNPGSHQFNIAKVLTKPMAYSEILKAMPKIKPGSLSATLSKSFMKTGKGKWYLPA